MPHRFAFAVVIAALLAPAIALGQISPEDVAQMRQVSGVQISPDGRHAAYVTSIPRTADEPPGRGFSELFVIPVDGGDPTTITQRPQPVSQPTWMADGRLAFVTRIAEEHEQAQVYAVGVNGRSPERLTASPEGVMGFAFSPDGSSVFYTARQPESRERVRERQAGFDQLVFGENERHVQLHVQEVGGESRTTLTPEDMTVREFAVSPDGQTVVLQMTRGVTADDDQMFRETYTVSVTGEDFERFVPTIGKLGMMAWSPDSRRVAYLSATALSDPLPHVIYVSVPDIPRSVTMMGDYEGTVEWLTWIDDDTILFAAVERQNTVLNRLDVGTGRMTRVLGGGAEIMRALSLADDGDRFAAAVHTRTHPAEVYVGRLSTGELTRLTDHNEWLAERRLGRQESIAWTGAHGVDTEGVLVYPLDYVEGRSYPLAILPHGGPEGISLDGWNTRALYPVQVMATEGYVVLKPNYRGSGGRGPAFSMANHRDLGGAEFEDVLLGIDHLAEMGLVDPERVGISGTSYGGYFSAWATTRHPERFRAGITFAGLSNWIAFMGTTDIPHEMSLVHWDLYWFEDPDLYNDRSPVMHVDRDSSPTLVVHGMADERVHLEQSLQLYNLLRLRDVPTGLIFYPREPHGLLERAHQLDFMHRVIDWFGTYVKPEAAPVDQEGARETPGARDAGG